MHFNSRLIMAAALSLLIASTASAQYGNRNKKKHKGPPPAPQGFVQHAESGKSLLVPKDQASLGTVFHALADRDTQMHFVSKAPVETIEGNSNRTIGYAVVRADDRLIAGEWHLPVNSIDTGNKTRNKHLTKREWLNAKKNPYIIFKILEVKDQKLAKEGEGFKTYSATLVGEFTIHGVTNKKTIPNATLSFRTQSASTEKVAQGDLLAIRAKYSVLLSDYKVEHPVISKKKKFANEVKIDTSLVLSTVAPEKQG